MSRAQPIGAAPGRRRRWARLAVTAVWAVAVISPAVVGGLLAAGVRPLVVRSGSMAPAIEAGDVILARTVRAGEVSPGDVISFRDPSRDRLVTHRVVQSRRRGPDTDFVTRGDANAGAEEWSIPVRGRLGLVVARVPGMGYAVALAAAPQVRVIAALGAVAALLVPASRRRRQAGGVPCDAVA